MTENLFKKNDIGQMLLSQKKNGRADLSRVWGVAGIFARMR
jgi:hypothetical protein